MPLDKASKTALVWADEDGTYVDSASCYTETCLANSVKFVNREAVGTVLLSLEVVEVRELSNSIMGYCS